MRLIIDCLICTLIWFSILAIVGLVSWLKDKKRRKKKNSDLISREALKEDMKSRLSACNEWIEKAKDKETKIRASAVKAFIAEVIMTIDNAPTVEPKLSEEQIVKITDLLETEWGYEGIREDVSRILKGGAE